MNIKYRKSNFFERVVLVIGLLVIILGLIFINKVYLGTALGLNWNVLQTIFLWLVLIVLIVLLATEEDVKEELGIIIREHIEETKILKEETQLLREISQDQLQEIRILNGMIGRNNFPKKKTSKK